MLSHFTKPTIEHQTQCRSLSYTHTHVMRCLPCICNVMHRLHNPHHSPGVMDRSHHLHLSSTLHFIHVNILCTYISTSTQNMPFDVQAMTHTQSSHVMASCTYGGNYNPYISPYIMDNYINMCHTPNPGPTRLADPNRVRGARLRTGTLYLFFFFFLKNPTGTCEYGPHLITESKYYIQIKRTTTGVVFIKI